MSAIRSARQQDTDPIELMVAAQRAPKPAASEALRIPARAGPAQRRAVAYSASTRNVERCAP